MRDNNYHSNYSSNFSYSNYNPSSNSSINKIYNNSDFLGSSNFNNNLTSNNSYGSFYQNDKYKYQDYRENYLLNDTKFGGIINYGKNCYLNSGLQILISCDEFVNELKRNNDGRNETNLVNLTKEAINTLMIGQKYDPAKFISLFGTKNRDFDGVQNCSQNFIRTLIKNLNDELVNYPYTNIIRENIDFKPRTNGEYNKYIDFIKSNSIYPESNLLSIFSGITESHSSCICRYCHKTIDEYSFNYFIDQSIYLDEINYRCNFRDVLDKNFENNKLTMDCPQCRKEINMDEVTKIIKLPEILIFTLERYQGTNNEVEIEPDPIIDMSRYVDINCFKGTKYKLFAINIRFGKTKNFGHEICQVERNGRWYEFNDEKVYERKTTYNKNSYGLFYKRSPY